MSLHTVDILRLRARVIDRIRGFFAERGALEVTTPSLIAAAASDFSTASFPVSGKWLRASPEFEMKSLLARGSGDIYQIGPVFRAGESGRRHRPEFTMLEWYRIGRAYEELLAEANELLGELLTPRLSALKPHVRTYQTAFEECFALDPFACDDAALMRLASDLGLSACGARHEALDFLFERMIGKCCGQNRLYAIKEFPAQQASFAKINSAKRAERFEIFYRDTELANGYREINTADEYLRRAENDNRTRRRLGLATVAADSGFASLLRARPLPESSGVSIGIDRVLMCIAGADALADICPLEGREPGA